jgi:RNA methyltransferase, TrmH family
MRTVAVTSERNPLIKSVRRAVARGTLTDEGWAVAEGFHLLEEAQRAGRAVKAVLVSESSGAAAARRIPGFADLPVYTLPDAMLRELSSTESPQGVMALVEPAAWRMEDVFRGATLAAILDGVQEPGNAGAIVRAAEAFGATGVLFLKGSANPHNPKSLRASAGSLFRLPYVSGVEDSVVLEASKQNGVRLFAAAPDAGDPLQGFNLREKCAFIIGSEGRGIRPELAAQAVALHIPTRGVESLNAAVAAGILLYEARRQRTVSP